MADKYPPPKMNEKVKKKWFLYCCATCTILLASSCSTSNKITIKQTQGGQEQETTIESDLKVKELSLNINSTYFK